MPNSFAPPRTRSAAIAEIISTRRYIGKFYIDNKNVTTSNEDDTSFSIASQLDLGDLDGREDAVQLGEELENKNMFPTEGSGHAPIACNDDGHICKCGNPHWDSNDGPSCSCYFRRQRSTSSGGPRDWVLDNPSDSLGPAGSSYLDEYDRGYSNGDFERDLKLKTPLTFLGELGEYEEGPQHEDHVEILH